MSDRLTLTAYGPDHPKIGPVEMYARLGWRIGLAQWFRRQAAKLDPSTPPVVRRGNGRLHRWLSEKVTGR